MTQKPGVYTGYFLLILCAAAAIFGFYFFQKSKPVSLPAVIGAILDKDLEQAVPVIPEAPVEPVIPIPPGVFAEVARVQGEAAPPKIS